jgi:ABC-type Fe3+-hydroxamate transport system substrate-binding protein
LAGLFNEVLGTEVTVPEKPMRIVSFSPAATETLFLIGAGDRVVGVSAFCARPPEVKEKRKVGSYNTVRHELLDDLKPDLIITVTGYQRDFAVDLSKKYPVYPLELPVSVAGIVDFVVKIGLVAGAPDAARELAGSLLRQLGQARKLGGARVYVEIDLGGPVTFGAHSYITDAIRLVGCSSIYERERSEWLKPDLKRVAEEDPDAILYEPKMFSAFSVADLKQLLVPRKWDQLRAVRDGTCFITPGPFDFLAHHGPSFITEAVPWLEEKLALAALKAGKAGC